MRVDKSREALRLVKLDFASIKSGPLGIWDAGEDTFAIPPRGWLLGTTFCRCYLSSLLADGGVGKSALRAAQLVSLATGKELTGEHVFKRSRVLILSFEDGEGELRRRMAPVLQHHNLSLDDVRGWLFLAAPMGLKLAKINNGTPTLDTLEHVLREQITLPKIDVVSLDPFIKTHELPENDNNSMDFVCGLLAKIAMELDCAVDLPHHTTKGGRASPGDADKGRGGSAMKDAARLVYTLTPMSAKEAKELQVGEEERRSLIRLDSGKVNLVPATYEARWFRLVGVALGNATGDYPAGDNVQTVEPWQPSETIWRALGKKASGVLEKISKGTDEGVRYSSAKEARKSRGVESGAGSGA